jgi:hypothetical protein
MKLNQIKQTLANAGMRAEAELQSNGLWLITSIDYVSESCTTIIEAPFEIPSLEAEKWLNEVLSSETDAAQNLEVRHG